MFILFIFLILLYSSGVIKKPSVLVMAKITEALGVNIEELIR